MRRCTAMTAAAATSSAPPASGAATATKQQQQPLIRPYKDSDQARIADICKNVYNGSDYMPRLIQQYAEDPSVTVLVAQPPQQAGLLAGLVCGRSHGGCMFLFGLRVAEAARGQGVARQLLERICQLGAADADVATLMSVTIPENAAALALFRRLSFTHHHTVDVFPSWPALRAFEAAAGIMPGSNPPAGHQHLLDALPGVRQLIEQSTAALGVQPNDWVRCGSSQQLQQAVADVRLQQLQRPGMQELPAMKSLAWLPGVYEAIPLSSHEVSRLLAEGRVWLLPAQQGLHHSASSSSSSGSMASASLAGSLSASASASSLLSYDSGDSAAALVAAAGDARPRWRAVVALAPDSPELRRSYACVLTAQDELVAAAVDLVGAKASHFVVFADRGSCHHRRGADDGAADALPALLLQTGAPSCYVVVSRPAGEVAGAACN